jgi:hypothetical protein
MVVDGDCKLLLRFVLANHILIEESFDFGWLGEVNVLGRRLVVLILIDDVLAYSHAFITDKNRGPCDQFTNVILALIAE